MTLGVFHNSLATIFSIDYDVQLRSLLLSTPPPNINYCIVMIRIFFLYTLVRSNLSEVHSLILSNRLCRLCMPSACSCVCELFPQSLFFALFNQLARRSISALRKCMTLRDLVGLGRSLLGLNLQDKTVL